MNKNQKILVCGSISYDTIMRTEDRFRDHILPSNLDNLNLAFHVPKLHRGFGGCAANICYNLIQLGCHGLPVATVGTDFERYRTRLEALGVDQRFIKVIEGQCTAQDHITTDRDNHQIAAFHPGAMDSSHLNSIDDFENTALGLISPDGLEGMRLHANQFTKAGVPFLFDPGQIIPLLTGDELVGLVDQARWAIFNTYEWLMFQEKTGWGHDELSASLEAHIVTAGGEGSTIYLQGETLEIDAAQVAVDKDPTGCGDAYRAGVVYGLLNGLEWQETGQLASTIGAICYESEGSQEHALAPAALYARYVENFGESADLQRALVTDFHLKS